jgi:hypothetical protein
MLERMFKIGYTSLLAISVLLGDSYAQSIKNTKLPSMEPVGGQPAAGSKKSVASLEEQVAYHRAFEAVIWAMPASAIYRFREGVLAIPGMADNVIIANSGPLTQTTELITANTVTPYISMFSDLRKGPLVLELPASSDKASLYGQIVDAWQVTIADVGPAGLDKGNGAKYLILPPGYNQAIPEGYYPIQSTTFRIGLAFRCVASRTGTNEDAYTFSKTLKTYQLAEAVNPPITKFKDVVDLPCHTLPFYDIRALQDIKEIIDVEPVREKDKVMMGMLATLGIVPGKLFSPTGKLKAAMERGVKDAYYYIWEQTDKLHAENPYWKDRNWTLAMYPDDNQEFEYDKGNAVEIDKRGAQWSYFTLMPKKFSNKTGVVYLAPTGDNTGKPLEAGKNYRLRVQKEVPARQFWSLTMYDHATRAFIMNPQKRNGFFLGQKDKPKVNEDGSVDIYIGPKPPPAGYENNWLPTIGKKPYLWFRFYAPAETFWDKSFKLNDFELIK